VKLEGSCHCRKVRFTVEAESPAPFNRCYCSICRKTAGSGGFGINIGAKAETMSVEGEEHVKTFHAIVRNEGEPDRTGRAERTFCGECGSALWVFNDEWPELIHPHASAIDSDLPEPPVVQHMMLGSKANWSRIDADEGDTVFDEYPDISLADWHKKHGLFSDD
jgi:hypothetical protein